MCCVLIGSMVRRGNSMYFTTTPGTKLGDSPQCTLEEGGIYGEMADCLLDDPLLDELPPSDLELYNSNSIGTLSSFSDLGSPMDILWDGGACFRTSADSGQEGTKQDPEVPRPAYCMPGVSAQNTPFCLPPLKVEPEAPITLMGELPITHAATALSPQSSCLVGPFSAVKNGSPFAAPDDFSSALLDFGMGLAGGSFTGSMTEADKMLGAAAAEVAGSHAEAAVKLEAAGGSSCTRSPWGSSPGNLSPGTPTAWRPNTRRSAARCSQGPALVCLSSEGSGSRGGYVDRMSPKKSEKQRIRKKVGRPIAFKGDINSLELSEGERRRLRRRKSNRESAARVRVKRQSHVGTLQIKIADLVSHNEQLSESMASAAGETAQLAGQLESLHRRWMAALSNNCSLERELATLRRAGQDTGIAGVGTEAPIAAGGMQPFEQCWNAAGSAALHASYTVA